MKQLYDKDGNKIPNEDIAFIAFDALDKVKKENKEKLYERICYLANKVKSSPIDFGREQAVEVVMMVENHDKYHPFKS